MDASGTLSFLLNDMSNSCTNATGIPSNTIQVPVQHLKNSLTHTIDLLSSGIECRNDVDFLTHWIYLILHRWIFHRQDEVVNAMK